MGKTTLITTIRNEEKAIGEFLDSLFQQSQLPDEIIIVDGASTDNTLNIIGEKYEEHILHVKDVPVKVRIKEGNRSVGRNFALKEATGDIILCVDGDNILDQDWIKEMRIVFDNHKDVDVVAGYYKGMPRNIFEKCLIPYVLVMPDKVDTSSFLPASRSMGFTKKIGEAVGGFPEEYSHNEDYVFAHELKKSGAKFAFAEKAIVYWRPRSSWKSAYTMFYRFAVGDAEAGIIRKKVIALFIRYILGVILLIASFGIGSRPLFLFLCVGIIMYILLAIAKNYKYVKHWKAVYYLPAIQFLSDFAVLKGTVKGVQNRWDTQKTQ